VRRRPPPESRRRFEYSGSAQRDEPVNGGLTRRIESLGDGKREPQGTQLCRQS
jgi:hypothetical protein